MFKIIVAVCLLPLSIFAQNTIGIPNVINYPKQNYSGGLQNWDATQDINGIIYFANNEGLLSFDGNYWKQYPLSNNTIVRSVQLGPDNRIYVGGQDEIGFFSPSSNGKLRYHSLIEKVPQKDRAFGDVWDIEVVKNDIFFRTPTRILRYSNNKFVAYTPPEEWSFMGFCNQNLYAHDFKMGLMIFKNESWQPIYSSVTHFNDPVTAIISCGSDTAIITTLKNGLFYLTSNGISRFNNNNNSIFETDRIYAATAVNNNNIALATSNNGVYIIDRHANILQRFSKTEGLQNPNVLSVFNDRQGNLWLGLDNGIDFINYNSAIKLVNPLQQDGSGYTAIIHHNTLYTGTSGGLFSVKLQNKTDLSYSIGQFSKVANTAGQNWRLAEINNQLLLGHHDGAYMIRNNVAIPFATYLGYWNFVPTSLIYPSKFMLSGTYKGISIFEYADNKFTFQKNIPDFEESSRFLVMDAMENIWVSHPYHGVYRIFKNTQENYQTIKYTDSNGLPQKLGNYVFKIKNEIVAATEKGIFTYNDEKDTFESADTYNNSLGHLSVRYLADDADGNVWFVHNKSLGIIDFSHPKPKAYFIPELNHKLLSGFEFIYVKNAENIFVGAEKGFYHINYSKYKQTKPALQTQIRQVRIVNQKDSLLFGGYFKEVNEKQFQTSVPTISYKWKSIRFEFTAPFFGNTSNIEFSFRLKGFDNIWSEYSSKTEKEYTNLLPGNYTFEVKAKTSFGSESSVASFEFTVLPPWYLATWAKFLYLIIIITATLILYQQLKKKFRLQKAKFENEQKRQSYIHDLEINKAESEMVTLRNEKLEAEINYKNSELASSAMHLVKKGELLTKIRSELTQVMKKMDNPLAITELKKMLRSFSDDDNLDNEWENFTKHFDKVHSDFIVALKEKHPNISSNEIKLCTYLRMNMSSKEIAQLMNISLRGVEISRYRLRKKLQISTDTNLFGYLINLHKEIDKNE